ncbi:MAG TPA: hypothetical protein VJT67_06610 [Longimicrobiaceae bacterium]|nr:hypothetical protein [Longimicrobiaceae bacterium]
MAFDPRLEEALSAVGGLLAVEDAETAIVVVGGATLNLLRLVERTTDDVDVIARAVAPIGDVPAVLVPPDPLPDALRRAIRRVSRDFGLAGDWMNTAIAGQWKRGLPPWLGHDIQWREYGGLQVGLVGRRTLIALKLFAAVDQSIRSVHAQDLIALAPTDGELEQAAEWVLTQDASEVFPRLVAEMVEHVRGRRGDR